MITVRVAKVLHPSDCFMLRFIPFTMTADVTVIIPLMRCNEHSVGFSQRMTRTWVPLALTETGLLNIMFLASCRHLAAGYQHQPQQEYLTRMAFQYKLKCLQSLRSSISVEAPSFSDSTVSKAIMLAYDEVKDTQSLGIHS